MNTNQLTPEELKRYRQYQGQQEPPIGGGYLVPSEQEEEIKETKKTESKKFLTLFLLATPSLLLAMTAIIDSVIYRIGFQLVLILLQFAMFKNLLDNYYLTK